MKDPIPYRSTNISPFNIISMTGENQMINKNKIKNVKKGKIINLFHLTITAVFSKQGRFKSISKIRKQTF